MKLDIGCGGSTRFKPFPRGDINCDIEIPLTKIQNFVRCDAHYLPFKTHGFSEVFMYEVLEHLESPFKALKDAQQILKEGGKLELTTPNALYVLKIVRSAKRGFYSVWEDHIITWGLPELKTLLEKVGFKQINIQYTHKDRPYRPIERFIMFLCWFKALRNNLLFAEAYK